ncbi:hypothetical protein [Pseudanabaena sp. 'Roaring Creek']|uniref:hypothetical protein n=1 Tax=Pseudanabaena sp. 'Roaring Creek' TaxID=1681830 RepID=UPI0006D7DCA0|nr:hypothetical protein [Pseudanabaena sp. 'Roaring Creek']
MSSLFTKNFTIALDGSLPHKHSKLTAWDIVGHDYCVWCGAYVDGEFENHHVFPKDDITFLSHTLTNIYNRKESHTELEKFLLELIQLTLNLWEKDWTVPICGRCQYSSVQEPLNNLGKAVVNLVIPKSIINDPELFPCVLDYGQINYCADVAFKAGVTQIASLLYLVLALIGEWIGQNVCAGSWIEKWLAAVATLQDVDHLIQKFIKSEHILIIKSSEFSYITNAILHTKGRSYQKAKTYLNRAKSEKKLDPVAAANFSRREAMLYLTPESVEESLNKTLKTRNPYFIQTARAIQAIQLMHEDYASTNGLTTEIIQSSGSFYQKIEAITVEATARYIIANSSQKVLTYQDELFTELYKAQRIAMIFRLQPMSLQDPATKIRLPILPVDVINMLLMHNSNFKGVQSKEYLNYLRSLGNKAFQQEINAAISMITNAVLGINNTQTIINNNYSGVTTIMSEKPQININQQYSTIGVGFAAEGSKQEFSQYNSLHEQNFELLLTDFKEFINDLQQEFPDTEDDETALQTINVKSQELKQTQSFRWQNFLNLKRLWNGGKKATIKVGEHFTEQNPWGKGAVAFLDGVMEDTK